MWKIFARNYLNNQPTNQPTSEHLPEKVVVIIMLEKARELTLL
jgi:hypothetical protein